MAKGNNKPANKSNPNIPTGNNGHGADPDPALRHALAEAVAQLRAQQEKLDQLQAGFSRAQEHGWQLSTAIDVNADDLAKAEAGEISRIANAFIANGGSTGESPVTALQARRAKLQQDDDRNDMVKGAITAEIAATETRIKTAHTKVAQALSNLLCGTDSFHRLYAERSECFAKLRGIRKCLAHIRHELSGQMPHDLSEPVDLIETYEYDRQGFTVDNGPVELWAQALSNLLEDPLNAALPGNG